MRRETSSRADRVGLAVVALLAIVGAVLFVSRQNNDPTVSSQGLTTAVSPVAPAEPTAIPTTLPIALPASTLDLAAHSSAESTSHDLIFVDADAAIGSSDSTSIDRAGAADSANDAGVAAAAPAADSTSSPSAVTHAETTSTTNASEPAASAAPDPQQAAPGVPNPQPAATAAPNPQPAATTVPNPQPAATAAPNPQPAATTVPNPQPAATAAPNPQPAAAVPADAPAGGTFTHTLTATVARPSLHTAPGGPIFTPTFNGTALPAVNPTVFGNALVYRVLAGQPGDAWAKVYVPARPNGTTAWVQTAQFNWGSSNRMLQINVATNTVTVFEGANVLLTTSAVTGKSSSPTPLASGWVEEIMAGPSAAYGTKLISLGMFSDVLNSFGGGIPKIALHGTNNPGLMGQAASNGCIRVRNEVINQIATILPVGSKVVIVG